MVEMLAATVAVATAELLDGRGRRRPAHFLLFPVPDEGPDSTAADDSVQMADDGRPHAGADERQHSASGDDDDGSHGSSDSNGSTVCTQNKLN